MTSNLFAGLPSTVTVDEQFATFLQRPGLRIERIVSTGQASPEGFWYDQDEGEWVTLLQGEAKLRFADETDARHLRAGDCLDIAAHRKHRVDWTAPDQVTVWLTVFYSATGITPGPTTPVTPIPA